jgi:hypothetical protein
MEFLIDVTSATGALLVHFVWKSACTVPVVFKLTIKYNQSVGIIGLPASGGIQ